MPAQPNLRTRIVSCASSAKDLRLGDLLRPIIHHLAKTNGYSDSNQKQHDAEQIILDTELDGVRYLLVQLPNVAETRIQLSPREQEIVRMVAEGHPNKVIAAVLNISSWTVCTHLRRVFAKLGVVSRAAMVARFLETGGVQILSPLNQKPADPQHAAFRLSKRPDTAHHRYASGNAIRKPGNSKGL